MERTQDYIVDSLELHLFFARIMKEHAFFLTVGFLPPNALPKRASSFCVNLKGCSPARSP